MAFGDAGFLLLGGWCCSVQPGASRGCCI